MQNAFGKLPIDSPARPFVAAALQLSGKHVSLNAKEDTRKEKLLNAFNADESRSKPIGFYTWTPELAQVWHFYRFLQTEFTDDDVAVVAPDGDRLRRPIAALLKQYRAIDGFYGRLTNPQMCLSMDLLPPNGSIRASAKEKGMRHDDDRGLPTFDKSSCRVVREAIPAWPAGGDRFDANPGPQDSVGRGESEARREQTVGFNIRSYAALRLCLCRHADKSETSCC